MATTPPRARERVGALSTMDVARLLGLRESQVRILARSALGTARRGRRYAFDFQDLVVLRAARALIERQVPMARVRRALVALAGELARDGRPLSGLRLYADGRHVVVRDGDTVFEPETGQIVLDFQVDELARKIHALPCPSSEAPGEDPRARARLAFQRALEREDEDPLAACDAYAEALTLDPDLVDAYINLGRLAHETGNLKEAVRLYDRALERSPDDPIVHFNLALALEDLQGPSVALPHYERALVLDPDFADAHYNLAAVYEQLGHRAGALRHYRAYQKLTDG